MNVSSKDDASEGIYHVYISEGGFKTLRMPSDLSEIIIYLFLKPSEGLELAVEFKIHLNLLYTLSKSGGEDLESLPEALDVRIIISVLSQGGLEVNFTYKHKVTVQSESPIKTRTDFPPPSPLVL
jgi:hypothetical protein